MAKQRDFGSMLGNAFGFGKEHTDTQDFLGKNKKLKGAAKAQDIGTKIGQVAGLLFGGAAMAGGGASGATEAAGAGAGAGAAGAGAAGAAAEAAPTGLIGKTGEALGFSGEGGGLMKGLGNVAKIGEMFSKNGNSGGGQPQPDPAIQFEQGQSYADPNAGFDPASYLPQYYNGGVPNDGKPAVIYDMRTNKPTGTMNERGPETIVPAYANGGDGTEFSIVDEQVPSTTKNIGVNPSIMSQSPTSSMGRPDLYGGKVLGEKEGEDFISEYRTVINKGEKGTTTTNPKKDVKRIEKRSTTETKGEDKDGFMGMGDFGDIVKSAARMYGYYTDTKRNNWGLGKSAITRFLDNADDMEASKKKTTGPSYEEKLKMKEESELRTAEGKAKIGAKYDKGKAKKSDEDYQKEAYDQMQEDVKSGIIDKAYLDESGNVKADEYLKDYISYQKTGKKAEIKDVDTGKTTKWFGRGDPIYKREKTGKDIDVTGNAGQQKLTAVKINKQKEQVLLSDGSLISMEEAKQKGLV